MFSGYSGIWSSLSALVGSKPLSRQDIEPVISKMQDHLMAKNVAADVATNLCNSVTSKLEGKICGKYTFLNFDPVIVLENKHQAVETTI